MILFRLTQLSLLVGLLMLLPLAQADGLPSAAASAQSGSAPPDAEYLILDAYDTLGKAQARAAIARREGGVIRVREEQVLVMLDNLRLGVYGDPAVAEAAIKRLRLHGIKGQLIGSAENGYAVSIGVFSDLENAQHMRDRLVALGFNNVQIATLQTIKPRYVVEKQLPPLKLKPRPGGAAKPVENEPAGGQPMVVQTPPPTSNVQKSERDVTWGVGLDNMRFETGWMAHGGQSVDASHYVHADADAHMQIGYEWELRLTGRLDGYYQTGIPGVQTTHVDYGESYIRYHGESSRITVGAQTVIWGRTDEIPPNDRMSVQDLSRFILDDLPQRRRAVPALRVEAFDGLSKTDILWVPEFRPAELPAFDSIWSPVDRNRGRIMSVDSTPILTQLVQQGRFTRDVGGQGGAGLRISGSNDSFDYAVTLQRTRHSEPYYALDPTVRAQLLGGAGVAAAIASSDSTFTELHPWSWFVGQDFAFEALSATWRAEATYVSAVPVTTSDYRYTTESGIDWVTGVEFYPGDGDTRVNIQLAGRELFDSRPVLDRTNIYDINGSVESPFLHSRWRAKLRFSFGLDKEDVYLNPELAYIGWEPTELYIAGHYFAGAQDTVGGYHQDHDMITLGWHAKY